MLESILPFYTAPKTMRICNQPLCHQAKIEIVPIEDILKALKREKWIEGLYAQKNDLPNIKRYKYPNGSYKNDFNATQFLTWINVIEDSTVICDMENKNVGKGIFISPKKILPEGTFIFSSGIIKLNPSKNDLETKNHCSALQDLTSQQRKIYGLIDPEKIGGVLDLINHAPTEEELVNFRFKNLSIKKQVATSNLESTIKFYNGYAIMGVEASQDIHGGKFGKQLLWPYAQVDEYLPSDDFMINHTQLLLFDQRDEHNGEIIDATNYSLKQIDIFFDIGEMMLRKAASITRWELMERAPESKLVLSLEDPYSSARSNTLKSSIPYAMLQAYLKKNPHAKRIIIKV